MTEEGASVYAAVLELRAKCQALQTEEETNAKIAAWEAERKAQDEQKARSASIEAARQRIADQKAYAEKMQREQDEKVRQGLVEVRIDPGVNWTMDWYERIVRHRVPDLNPRALDKELGTLALLRAIDMLELRRQQGRPPRDPEGFVVHEARKAMTKRGGPTTWVPLHEAQLRPELIVRRYSESYAGKVSERWAKRQAQLQDDKERMMMGLMPRWQVEQERKRKRL